MSWPLFVGILAAVMASEAYSNHIKRQAEKDNISKKIPKFQLKDYPKKEENKEEKNKNDLF